MYFYHKDFNRYRLIASDELLLSDRIIWLWGPLDSMSNQTFRAARDALIILDAVEKKPIRLLIDSPGGSVPDGLVFIDLMRMVKSPVHTYCFQAASMAAFIFISGDRRFLLPHSRLMFHAPQAAFIWGSVEDHSARAKEGVRLNDCLLDILMEQVGLSRDEAQATMKIETWLTPEKAVDKGFGDQVVKSFDFALPGRGLIRLGKSEQRGKSKQSRGPESEIAY